MKRYHTQGTAALWNDFDQDEKVNTQPTDKFMMPGISLLRPEEAEILETLSGDDSLLSRVLLVKAILQGQIIGQTNTQMGL